MNLISEAISIAGRKNLAKSCGVTHQAVKRWERNGHLPRTEWTEETNYSEIITNLCADNPLSDGSFLTKELLLAVKPGSTKVAAAA